MPSLQYLQGIVLITLNRVGLTDTNSTMKTAMLLPSIMRRVDDLLLVKEMDAKFFDHAVREDLLHNAICTPSAGLEYDYERLELLGTCSCS